jgi:hypothetical protein
LDEIFFDRPLGGDLTHDSFDRTYLNDHCVPKNPVGLEAVISSRDLEAGGDHIAPSNLSAIPADVLERINADVASIPDIQEQLLKVSPALAIRDRVAHQYQIAGGKVVLRISPTLPSGIEGCGLFVPGQVHVGIGRVSTGLGCPHAETDPDFLGLRLAFMAPEGRRVDFITINHPSSPTDDHPSFVALLHATVTSTKVAVPIGGPWAVRAAASSLGLTAALVGRLGVVKGIRTALHVARQTFRTAWSKSAVQPYWTGVVEIGGRSGKFIFLPAEASVEPAGTGPRSQRLTRDWQGRQAAGPIAFEIYWMPFIDEAGTSKAHLSRAWKQQLSPIGQVVFPRQLPDDEAAGLWAVLADEMGAHPGNWVGARNGSVDNAVEFAAARTIAYRASQSGRGALPEETYREVFMSGELPPSLEAELRRRRDLKLAAGHVSYAEASC